jgi:hypothetical protein
MSEKSCCKKGGTERNGGEKLTASKTPQQEKIRQEEMKAENNAKMIATMQKASDQGKKLNPSMPRTCPTR